MSLLALAGGDRLARVHLQLAQLNAATALGMHDVVDDIATTLETAADRARECASASVFYMPATVTNVRRGPV